MHNSKPRRTSYWYLRGSSLIGFKNWFNFEADLEKGEDVTDVFSFSGVFWVEDCGLCFYFRDSLVLLSAQTIAAACNNNRTLV